MRQILLLTSLFAGCLMSPSCTSIDPKPGKNEPTPPAPPAVTDPVVTPPTVNSGNIMATVNGHPIPMEKLNEILVRDFGFRPAKNLIADEVVRQELKKRKLPYEVTEAEIQKETVLTLRRIFKFVKTPPPSQLEKLRDQFISTHDTFSRRAWNATIQRNVRLSRVAVINIGDITDEDIQRAFFDEFDGKRLLRTIQVRTYAEARAILKRLEKEDFATLAKTYSNHPTSNNGGLLPLIGTKTVPPSIPAAIARVARELKHEGDISSPIVCEAGIHILKLEKIIPPSKDHTGQDVKLDDVAESLRLFIREIRIFNLRTKILEDMIRKSDIQYINPIIRADQREFETDNTEKQGK